MFRVDTKRLPLLISESKNQTREHPFVGIDDYYRELFAEIHPDKSQFGAVNFLIDTVLAQCPYTITWVYSDNGRCYQ